MASVMYEEGGERQEGGTCSGRKLGEKGVGEGSRLREEGGMEGLREEVCRRAAGEGQTAWRCRGGKGYNVEGRGACRCGRAEEVGRKRIR